jgi:predicted permease
MGTLGRDFRFALRMLRKNPSFSIVAILTLALGIGANAAIFSILDAVILRSLPFPDSGRIVRLFHVPPQRSFPGMKLFALSPANYLDWKAQSQSFAGMSPYSLMRRARTGEPSAESLAVGQVPPDFFDVVRAQPQLGRVFALGEDQPGSPHIAILSNRIWRNDFGGRTDIIGKDIFLEHERYTIIGVMPASFEYQAWSITGTDLWTPLVWKDADRAVRGIHNYDGVALLKPGVSVQQANTELATISARLAAAYPKEDTDWGATSIPLHDYIMSAYNASTLWILLGAVGFVLLIACANIANLVLARGLSRSKEMAIRAAIGANRAQLVRQSLAETVVLSVLGGAVGFTLARLAIYLGSTFLADQLPPGTHVVLNAAVFSFTLAISLLSGFVGGLAPALRLSKADLNEVLKQGSGRGAPSAERPRQRGLLIVSEVALSLMLLVGAGLMIRTLWALHAVNPGFDPQNVLSISFGLPKQRYATPVQQTAFYDELLRRTRALPGVECAALIDSLPLTGGSQQPITIEGRPAADAQDALEVATRQASPGYIRTLRIPLIRGRDFREDDDHALLISQAMAKAYWPNEDPLGRRVSFTFTPGVAWQIVGVVGDIPVTSLSSLEPRATAYQWTREMPWAYLTLTVHTKGDPAALERPITEVVRALDPELPLRNFSTMTQILESSIASQQFIMQMLAGFAAIALLLAACGIYGVLSYAVRRRAREIGIRAALGARVGQILTMVLAEAMKPVGAGIAIGLVGALSLGRLLRSLLFGVKATDGATLVVVSLLLAAVACAASLIPAWRATRVDPLQVLREE